MKNSSGIEFDEDDTIKRQFYYVTKFFLQKKKQTNNCLPLKKTVLFFANMVFFYAKFSNLKIRNKLNFKLYTKY